VSNSNYPPIVRGEGATESERHLQRLTEKSFLRLWSYPGVQRKSGLLYKELTDLLVVMGNHVLLFSDKQVAFDMVGPVEVAWARWHREAIMASVKQLRGAERLLFAPGTTLALDAKGAQPFPIAIPDRAAARVHRIAVAHGAAEACLRNSGGTGSFFISPDIGDSAKQPFVVGDVDPKGGFVHVLNDHSLEVVIKELDTLPDFVAYLEAREALIRGGRLAGVPGEEELLGVYLRNGTPEAHAFPRGKKGFSVFFPEGHWETWRTSPERAAREAADKVSYVWDDLLADFGQHLLDGTSIVRTHSSVADNEFALRVMATTTRTQRRALGERLIEILSRPCPPRRPWSAGLTQVTPAGGLPAPAFVIIGVPNQGKLEEDYRLDRQGLLRAYTMVALLLCPDAPGAFGIATEPIRPHGSASHDICYIDCSDFDAAAEAEARRYRKDLHIFTEVAKSGGTVFEYPTEEATSISSAAPAAIRTSGKDRNKPCVCGSGRKQKKCCG
jgi:hypothetical protein